MIKLVNYLRRLDGDVEAGIRFCQEIKEGKEREDWKDDKYLIPVDSDDAMLCVDYHQLIAERLE